MNTFVIILTTIILCSIGCNVHPDNPARIDYVSSSGLQLVETVDHTDLPFRTEDSGQQAREQDDDEIWDILQVPIREYPDMQRPLQAPDVSVRALTLPDAPHIAAPGQMNVLVSAFELSVVDNAFDIELHSFAPQVYIQMDKADGKGKDFFPYGNAFAATHIELCLLTVEGESAKSPRCGRPTQFGRILFEDESRRTIQTSSGPVLMTIACNFTQMVNSPFGDTFVLDVTAGLNTTTIFSTEGEKQDVAHFSLGKNRVSSATLLRPCAIDSECSDGMPCSKTRCAIQEQICTWEPQPEGMMCDSDPITGQQKFCLGFGCKLPPWGYCHTDIECQGSMWGMHCIEDHAAAEQTEGSGVTYQRTCQACRPDKPCTENGAPGICERIETLAYNEVLEEMVLRTFSSCSILEDSE